MELSVLRIQMNNISAYYLEGYRIINKIVSLGYWYLNSKIGFIV